MAVLALEFRPRTFTDVVGQSHVTAVLRAMVRTDRVPPALVFAGTRGTGKTSVARILAAALNCDADVTADACGRCESCQAVADGRSLALLEVDAASHGLIDDVRRIQELVTFEYAGGYRVVALDEAHSMSRPAFNALLKMLEEPPARTVFVLLTTEPERIPDTVASRAMSFEFRRLSPTAIAGRLAAIASAKGITATDDLLAEIAVRAEGGMRDAVMQLDQCTYTGVHDVEGYRGLFGITEVGTDLVECAVRGDHVGAAALIDRYFARSGDAQAMVADLVATVRDVIIYRAGGTPPTGAQAPQERRRALAEALTLGQLVATVRVLWELKARTRATASDHRSEMEMAFVLIAEALAPSEPIQQVDVPTPDEAPLTQAELEAIVASYSRGGEAP